MIKPAFSILFFLLTISSIGQNTVRVEFKSLPDYHEKGSAIYIAGSFNGWNPREEKHKFQQDNKGNYFLELQLDPGKYEYKITRGGWDKVETKKEGGGIENRVLEIPAGKTIEIDIEGWADHFAAAPKKSSASKNVQILTDKFYIPQFAETRRVWIYLPPDYSKNNKSRYAVLYMHDGQNVFEDSSSFSGEWGVDEFMDTVKHRYSDTTVRTACIVVAIDHAGPRRINEYSPYDMEKYGKGEGGKYVDFLVKTLKPFIDKHFRTLKQKETTYIAGSSMGGLISMYAILKYPKVFGAAGVFSPAFWIAPKIYDDIDKKGEKIKGKIYFYVGKQESESMVTDMLKVFERMHAVSKANMETVIRDEGKHNEPTWRKEFPLFYKWIMR